MACCCSSLWPDEPSYHARCRVSQGSTSKQGFTSTMDKGKAPASTSRPRGRFQSIDEDQGEDEDEDEDGDEHKEEEEEDIGDDDISGFDDVNPENVVLDDDDDDDIYSILDHFKNYAMCCLCFLA